MVSMVIVANFSKFCCIFIEAGKEIIRGRGDVIELKTEVDGKEKVEKLRICLFIVLGGRKLFFCLDL